MAIRTVSRGSLRYLTSSDSGDLLAYEDTDGWRVCAVDSHGVPWPIGNYAFASESEALAAADEAAAQS